jgi:hypothetical protein
VRAPWEEVDWLEDYLKELQEKEKSTKEKNHGHRKK